MLAGNFFLKCEKFFFPCVQANKILSIKLIGSRMLSRQVGAWLWIWTTISTPQISKISQFISLRISCSRHWILSTIHTIKNLGFSTLKIQHWTWHELPILSSFHLMLGKSYWAVLNKLISIICSKIIWLMTYELPL